MNILPSPKPLTTLPKAHEWFEILCHHPNSTQKLPDSYSLTTHEYHGKYDREKQPYEAVTIMHSGVAIYEDIHEYHAEWEFGEEAFEAINNPGLGAANVAADRKGAELLEKLRYQKGWEFNTRTILPQLEGKLSFADLENAADEVSMKANGSEVLTAVVPRGQTLERVLGKDPELQATILATYEKHAQLERINENIAALDLPESQSQKENENEA